MFNFCVRRNVAKRRNCLFAYTLIAFFTAVFLMLTLMSYNSSSSRRYIQEPLSRSTNSMTFHETRDSRFSSLELRLQYVNESPAVNVQQRQQLRRDHVMSACQSKVTDYAMPDLIPTDFSHLFVNDLHDVLYCAVPKVATSNWKRVMLMLTGKMNVSKIEDLPSADVHGQLQQKYLVHLSQFTPLDKIKPRLDSYFKFLFVRHPFERIVSAYENKFATKRNSYFHKRLGREIIRRFRTNPSSKSLQRGHDVTFEEFVRYLIDWHSEEQHQSPLNEHWRPFTDLCKPCQVQYDVIGKYETLADDAAFVLDAINASSLAALGAFSSSNNATIPLADSIHFPGVGSPSASRRTNRWKDVQLRFSTLTAEQVHKLAKLYSDDMRLFGYGYQIDDSGLSLSSTRGIDESRRLHGLETASKSFLLSVTSQSKTDNLFDNAR